MKDRHVATAVFALDTLRLAQIVQNGRDVSIAIAALERFLNGASVEEAFPRGGSARIRIFKFQETVSRAGRQIWPSGAVGESDFAPAALATKQRRAFQKIISYAITFLRQQPLADSSLPPKH